MLVASYLLQVASHPTTVGTLAFLLPIIAFGFFPRIRESAYITMPRLHATGYVLTRRSFGIVVFVSTSSDELIWRAA